MRIRPTTITTTWGCLRSDDDNDGICDSGGHFPRISSASATRRRGVVAQRLLRGRGEPTTAVRPQSDQIDIGQNGRGLRCDPGEADMLSGNWRRGRPADPVRRRYGRFLVPIAPAAALAVRTGCIRTTQPAWTSACPSVRWSTSWTIAASCSRGRPPASQTLEFRPATDFFYRAPSGGPALVMPRRMRCLPRHTLLPRHFPSRGVELNRDYLVTVTVRSWVRPGCVGAAEATPR